MSEQTTCRKTYQETLRPTPTQERERERERVVWCCRTLYNAALEQRSTAWTRCHGCLTRSQQEAELTAIREAMPQYAALHSHVLQDVLARLDTTSQAFVRRVQAGERAGFPRFRGRERSHSFTYKECGTGARLENGCLVRSKIGRSAVRWSRPVQGSIKTLTVSREADGWYVCCSCAQVPTQPLALTGRETGIDVGVQVLLSTADGQSVATARHSRRAERNARSRRPSGASRAARRGGSAAARRGGSAAARRCGCWRACTSTYADSAPTSTTRPRLRWYAPTTRCTSRRSSRPT